jgi:hypothetical protein
MIQPPRGAQLGALVWLCMGLAACVPDAGLGGDAGETGDWTDTGDGDADRDAGPSEGDGGAHGDGDGDGDGEHDAGVDAGWIDTWVPPPPAHREEVTCAGSATSCYNRTVSSCLDGDGCWIDGDCRGISDSCYYQNSHYACIDLDGCYWNSSSDYCAGSSWSCSTYSSSAACIDQDGCSWRRECAGTATSCSLLDPYSCEGQPGCSLECPDELAMCDTTCVDLTDDEQHCGECGFECGSHGDCKDGICECAEPFDSCFGKCVNMDVDEDHCGECGRSCGNGFECVAGDCVDIDECDAGICRDGRTCTNRDGGYVCGPCAAGYRTDGPNECADIDECATNHGGCDPAAPCYNSAGSFSCGACPAGYTGTGSTRCTDIDECRTNNGGCSAMRPCHNFAGGRYCESCPHGYWDASETECTDIDECSDGSNGGCDWLTSCTNSTGGRQCGACPDGYTGTGATGCIDIDECTQNNGGCAALRACINTAGGRECGSCAPGYTTDGPTGCADIDECAVGNGGCHGLVTCQNIPGGRTCGACPSGYSGDGVRCTDINECSTANGGCDPLTVCTNTAGSRTCGGCPTGYTGDGASGCVDIDECASSNGGCDSLTPCTNFPGSRSCGECPSGYAGYGATGCTTALVDLVASVGRVPAFYPGSTHLSVHLPRSESSVSFTATVLPSASLKIDGVTVGSGEPSRSFLITEFPVSVLVEEPGRGSHLYQIDLYQTLAVREVDVVGGVKLGAVAADGDTFAVTTAEEARRIFVYRLGESDVQREATLPVVEGYNAHRPSVVVHENTLAFREFTPYPERNSVVAVYERNGSTWTRAATLKSEVAIGGISANFGQTLSLQGDRLVISDPGYTHRNADGTTVFELGAVHVFERSAGAWHEVQRVIPPDNLDRAQYFGQQLKLDGDALYISRSLASTGDRELLRYIHDSTGWTAEEERFSFSITDYTAIDVKDERLVLGRYWSEDSARVYTREASGWGTEQTLIPFYRRSGAFGSPVALGSDGWLAVSDQYEEGSELGVDAAPEPGGWEAGAVYLYERAGLGFQQRHHIKSSALGRWFGLGIAMTERHLFVVDDTSTLVRIYQFEP